MLGKIPGFNRFSARRALPLIVLSVGLSAAQASDGVATEFNIAAQPLAEALHVFSDQSNIDVITPSANVSGRQAPAVRGSMTAEKALEKLLDGTGLSVKRSDDGSFLIIQSLQDQRSQGYLPQQYAQASSAEGAEQSLQTTQTPAYDEAPDGEEMEWIVVKGFRRSLESALEVKRNSNYIVDSISSEGIGRFPDLNLGEALQRVTGVQIERGERRRAEIAIRGLPRKFALTRVNNMAMASPDLRNAFSFGIFESSIFSGSDVIKTPTAAMDDGGLSGIVNVKTPRPLSLEEDAFSITAGTSFEELADEVTPLFRARGNKNFSDSLAGFFSAAWSDQDFRRDVAAVTDYDLDGNGIQVANDFRYRVDTTEGDRMSLAGGLEWQATSELRFGFSGVYTEYEQTTVRDQLRIRNCSDTAVDIVGNTAVRSTHTSCRFEAETRERKDFDETWAATLDGTWERGPWWAQSVVHFTRGEHDGNLIQMRRRINNAPGVVTVNTGSGTPGNFQIDVEGFDPGSVSTWSFTNPNVQTRFFPEGANNKNTDTEVAFQLDIVRDLGWGALDSVQFGFKYRDREQESVDQDATNDDVDLSVLDDSIFRNSLIGDSDFFDGRVSAFPVVTPDVFAVLDRVLPLNTSSPLNDEGFVLDQDFLATFDTQQDITAGYFMLNFDSESFDLPVGITGNVGLRYVKTDRETRTFQDIDGEVSRLSVPFDFTDVLPAVNLAVELREDLVLRTSYTETIVRPNPNDFRAGTQLSVGDGGESVTVIYGNPELEPFSSESIDLSLEWYHRPGSAVTLAYFRKKIAQNTIDRQFCPTNLADFSRADAFSSFVTGNLNGDIDPCLDEAGVRFNISDVVNSNETFSINGFEIGVLQNFDFLSAPFNNFGIQANYTYIDADESGELDEDGNPAPLEEVSEHTANLITYYEAERWGIRLAYNFRSDYFTRANRGPSGGNRSIDDRHQLDLSFNYNATPQLSLGLEALNLNNAKVYEFENNKNRLRNYSYDGRTLVLIATYSF